MGVGVCGCINLAVEITHYHNSKVAALSYHGLISHQGQTFLPAALLSHKVNCLF